MKEKTSVSARNLFTALRNKNINIRKETKQANGDSKQSGTN